MPAKTPLAGWGVYVDRAQAPAKSTATSPEPKKVPTSTKRQAAAPVTGSSGQWLALKSSERALKSCDYSKKYRAAAETLYRMSNTAVELPRTVSRTVAHWVDIPQNLFLGEGVFKPVEEFEEPAKPVKPACKPTIPVDLGDLPVAEAITEPTALEIEMARKSTKPTPPPVREALPVYETVAIAEDMVCDVESDEEEAAAEAELAKKSTALEAYVAFFQANSNDRMTLLCKRRQKGRSAKVLIGGPCPEGVSTEADIIAFLKQQLLDVAGLDLSTVSTWFKFFEVRHGHSTGKAPSVFYYPAIWEAAVPLKLTQLASMVDAETLRPTASSIPTILLLDAIVEMEAHHYSKVIDDFLSSNHKAKKTLEDQKSALAGMDSKKKAERTEYRRALLKKRAEEDNVRAEVRKTEDEGLTQDEVEEKRVSREAEDAELSAKRKEEDRQTLASYKEADLASGSEQAPLQVLATSPMPREVAKAFAFFDPRKGGTIQTISLQSILMCCTQYSTAHIRNLTSTLPAVVVYKKLLALHLEDRVKPKPKEGEKEAGEKEEKEDTAAADEEIQADGAEVQEEQSPSDKAGHDDDSPGDCNPAPMPKRPRTS